MEIEATLSRIQIETPTVKSFLLDLGSSSFDFKPGQWVDFYIETELGIEVGGFSITSSPVHKETIELAIKKIPRSKCSIYLHEKAKVGDSFFIDGGQGDFYYQGDPSKPLVLIGGGIGITPLMSMIRYIHEANLDVNVTLIYSAVTQSELVFFDELNALAAKHPNFNCIFTVTQAREKASATRFGRIDETLLEQHIPSEDSLFYICGPESMINEVNEMLEGLGVKPNHIRFERWW